MQGERTETSLVVYLVCAATLTVAGCAAWREGWTLHEYQGQLRSVKNGGAGAVRLQIESDYDPTVRDFVQQNGEPDYIYVVDDYTLKLIYVESERLVQFERRWYNHVSQATVTVGPDALQSVYQQDRLRSADAETSTPPPTPTKPVEASPTPAISAGERRVVFDKIEEFYASNPTLEDRKQCVVRVLATLSVHEPTWRELVSASYAACFPSRSWVNVVTDQETGKSSFIDSSRIEARQNHQVTFWVMTEVFDSEHDFLISRDVADCDARAEATVHSAWLVAGRYEDSGPLPMEWESELPGSVGEAILNAACRYRTAVTRPRPKSRPPKQPSPLPDSGKPLPLRQPI